MSRTRLIGYAVSTALLLVVVSATAGATAAGLITGAQIKNGTITSVDLKNRTVAKKDLSRKVSRSLAGGRIPSGKTVRGFAGLQVPSTTSGNFAVTVDLPGDAGKRLTASDVNFGAGSGTPDDDPACTGSPSAPTAPAGKVCLYLVSSDTDSSNYYGGGVSDRRSFIIGWSDSASNSIAYVSVRWAYTAP